MIVESKAPGFPAVEIFANTVGEFIDQSFSEWAFYWGEDVDTDLIASAWTDLAFFGFATAEGVTYIVKH